MPLCRYRWMDGNKLHSNCSTACRWASLDGPNTPPEQKKLEGRYSRPIVQVSMQSNLKQLEDFSSCSPSLKVSFFDFRRFYMCSHHNKALCCSGSVASVPNFPSDLNHHGERLVPPSHMSLRHRCRSSRHQLLARVCILAYLRAIFFCASISSRGLCGRLSFLCHSDTLASFSMSQAFVAQLASSCSTSS